MYFRDTQPSVLEFEIDSVNFTVLLTAQPTTLQAYLNSLMSTPINLLYANLLLEIENSINDCCTISDNDCKSSQNWFHRSFHSLHFRDTQLKLYGKNFFFENVKSMKGLKKLNWAAENECAWCKRKEKQESCMICCCDNEEWEFSWRNCWELVFLDEVNGWWGRNGESWPSGSLRVGINLASLEEARFPYLKRTDSDLC